MMDDKLRGEHANNILGNPVFKQAIEALEREVVDAWENCPARDHEGKEYFWQLYKNTKKFVNIFRGYVEAGKLQIAKEQEEQSRLQRLKDNVTKFTNKWR